jgi:signal transduction histidine kinase
MPQWFSSLRFRLILFVLLAALPALLITLFTGLEQRKDAASQAQQEVMSLAHLAAINQDMFVENTRMFMISMAHLPALGADNPALCDSLFSHIVDEHHPYYETLYITDPYANIICHASGTHIPAELEECPHYQKTLKSSDFVVGNYHICDVSGHAILGIAYPILDDQGELKHILHVSLDLGWINELAADAQLPPGSTLDVFNKDGAILTHYPDPIEKYPRQLEAGSFLSGLISQEEATAVGAGFDGVRRLYTVTPLQGGDDKVYVTLGIPEETAFAEANRTLRRNMLILSLMTGLAVAAAWLLGDVLIVRQTNALLSATRRLEAGDLNARSGISSDGGELSQLARAFDQMAGTIQQRETERDKAEAAMKAYAEDLMRSNRDLQDFANITSHDLQEPLRKIQTFSGMLQDRYQSEFDERGQGYIRRINDSAERMQALIQDLLIYSRVTSRGQPFERVDLNEVVRSVLNDLEILIEETQAHIDRGYLPIIDADATQMRQLIQNLLSNALKFRKNDETPRIKIEARIFNEAQAHTRSDPAIPCCELRVSDNGIGFEEKYLDRIFQPFQRLHGRSEYQGTGMGLAICRKITERHGGSITAESRPGKGTTFIVRLPTRQTNKER